MSSRSFIEKKRKIFSRLFAVALCVLILISRSGWEQYGLVSDYLFLIGITMAGMATVGRLWCSLYICGYKTNKLISVGPYSLCRNPLYFFSLLGGIGVGLATETLTVTLIIFAAFVLYYPFMIRAEERKLQKIHGDEFDRYVKNTPRFWPSFNLLNEPEEYTVRPKLFRKRVFDALWFIWLVGILEIIEALHEYNIIPILFRLY